MTNSQVKIKHLVSDHLERLLVILREIGVPMNVSADTVEILPHSGLKGFHVDTAPYPGYPTDMQAQLMALATTVTSTSVITEHIFENRFMHVPELIRLGAKIMLKGHSAFIEPGQKLTGAPVMCTDLRASAALVLAALVADGETEIRRIYHLDRGYDKIDEKLNKLGAKIQRIYVKGE
jgi:UDP-N-acetylglucosamine 1-carboxyvinyltransferase